MSNIEHRPAAHVTPSRIQPTLRSTFSRKAVFLGNPVRLVELAALAGRRDRRPQPDHHRRPPSDGGEGDDERPDQPDLDQRLAPEVVDDDRQHAGPAHLVADLDGDDRREPFATTSSITPAVRIATNVASCGSPVNPRRPSRTRTYAAPPATAAIAIDAWLASTPYQGCDWSSRRSVVGEEGDPRAGGRAAEDHRGADERQVEREVAGVAGRDRADRAEQAEHGPQQDAAGRPGECRPVQSGARDGGADRHGDRERHEQPEAEDDLRSGEAEQERLPRTAASAASSGSPPWPEPRSSRARKSRNRRCRPGGRDAVLAPVVGRGPGESGCVDVHQGAFPMTTDFADGGPVPHDAGVVRVPAGLQAAGRGSGRRRVPPPDPRSARCGGEAVVPPLVPAMVPDAVTSGAYRDCTDPRWNRPDRTGLPPFAAASH